MSNHVDELLLAYLDRRLDQKDASRVYQHLLFCSACRNRLTIYERLSTDLRIALYGQPIAKPAEVAAWWHTIAFPHVHASHSRGLLVIAPALLVLIILGLPLLTSLPGVAVGTLDTVHHMDATQASTGLAENQPVAGVIPQPQQGDQITTAVATASPQETIVPVAPVPLAPSMP